MGLSEPFPLSELDNYLLLVLLLLTELHSSLGLRGFDLRENEVTRFLFGGTIPRFTRTWFTRMDLLTEKVARIK